MCLRFLIAWILAAVVSPLYAAPAEGTNSAASISTNNAVNPMFKDEMDKVSYSLGMSIGVNLKPVPDLRTNAFLAGFFDVQQGKKTLLSEAERDDLLKHFDELMQVRRASDLSVQADKNRTDGENFLAANAKKEGVKILNDGLQYKVITSGSGPMPKNDDTVTVHYRGTLIDGRQFDSSYDRKVPNSFRLTQVIRGWSEALQAMPVGSKWQLFVPAELGYGGNNNIREIPPNSVLLYELELLSIAPTTTSTK